MKEEAARDHRLSVSSPFHLSLLSTPLSLLLPPLFPPSSLLVALDGVVYVGWERR